MKRLNVVVALALCGVALLAVQWLRPLGSKGPAIDPAAFEAAESAYAEGMALRAERPEDARARFLASAAAFEVLLATNDAAGIHFNRANALLQGGRTADAIASYLAAERRLPGDRSIADNLAEARSRVVRATDRPTPPLLERLSAIWLPLSTTARTFGAACLLWTAAIALCLGRRRVTALLAALGIVLGATATIDAIFASKNSAAVVARETVLRKGNGEGFEPALSGPLPAGTECEVLEVRPGWIEVRCSADVLGWVRDDALLRVR
jgi:hypothetical protein